jgi:hypothetical protein
MLNKNDIREELTIFKNTSYEHIFTLLSVWMLFAWVIHWIVAYLSKLVWATFEYSSFIPFLQQTGFRVLVIFICIVGPIVEELVFRLPLRPILLYIVISKAVVITYILSVFIHISWLLLIGVIILLACLLYALLRKYKLLIEKKIWHILSYRLHYLLWFQAIVFWLLHIANYEILQPWWIGVLLVIPQIILWYILWYERVKRGWAANVVHHMLHNTFLFLPFIFFYLWGYDITVLLKNQSLPDSFTLSPLLQWFLFLYGVLYLIIWVTWWKAVIRYFRFWTLLWKSSS